MCNHILKVEVLCSWCMLWLASFSSPNHSHIVCVCVCVCVCELYTLAGCTRPFGCSKKQSTSSQMMVYLIFWLTSVAHHRNTPPLALHQLRRISYDVCVVFLMSWQDVWGMTCIAASFLCFTTKKWPTASCSLFSMSVIGYEVCMCVCVCVCVYVYVHTHVCH